jgi:lysine N6-hydroxylase
MPTPDGEPADVPRYHTIGVGAGPANLSLAALFRQVAPERMVLFDKQPGPNWHPQLLHAGVRMQTSWVKDLVSLVDPCHPLTFLSYIVSTGRIYALLNAQYDVIPRQEYVAYLAWAAEQIPDLHYGVAVDEVSFTEGTGFTAHSGGRPIARSDHLVVGLGTQPYVPDRFGGLPAEDVFVADDLSARTEGMDRMAPVAVVGGGQTGAECVLELLATGFSDIHWFGRRAWFSPLDDSPPANDFYRPAYLRFLQGLRRESRRELVEEQTLTGDAISPGSLKAIYQANYEAMLTTGAFPVTLYPGRDVLGARRVQGGYQLRVRATKGPERHLVRYVVLAVGRRNAPLPFAPELAERIELDNGDLMVDEDYSVRWKGSNGHKIFAQNRARWTHGVLDANLTLLPIRSAIILNSMFGRRVYSIRDEEVSTVW